MLTSPEGERRDGVIPSLALGACQREDICKETESSLRLGESPFLLRWAMSDFPSLSTDQVAAFIELAQTGSLRRAAEKLHLTEQGVRNRLLMLEHRLGATLYQKRRGPRRQQPLTEQGQEFLPHALAFLERARQLAEVFHETPQPREIRVAATQYMIIHALIRV